MLPFLFATWAFLIETILVSMKCDGRLENSASWMLIWTPMWFVNLLLLIVAVLSFPDFVNEKGESIELKDTPVVIKIFHVVLLILVMLVQVFLFLKLDNVIDWNWFAVFSPWLARECVLSVRAVRVAIIADPDLYYPTREVLKLNALRDFACHLVRAWVAVFIALKLNHQNDWNWGLVLLPVWVYIVLNYAFSAYYLFHPELHGVKRSQSTVLMWLFGTTISCIWIPVWLARRLEVRSDGIISDYTNYS
jgi:Transmembrane Fragile-X-F protein